MAPHLQANNHWRPVRKIVLSLWNVIEAAVTFFPHRREQGEKEIDMLARSRGHCQIVDVYSIHVHSLLLLALCKDTENKLLYGCCMLFSQIRAYNGFKVWLSCYRQTTRYVMMNKWAKWGNDWGNNWGNNRGISRKAVQSKHHHNFILFSLPT